MKKIKLIAIVGPTASGKTELAIFLAKKFNGELISADSRQIYRRMDIGTAKLAKNLKIFANTSKQNLLPQFFSKRKEKEKVIIHLIDVVTPDKEYNVADFIKDAKFLTTEITKRGRLPIIVGGTGLWVEALLENYVPAPKVSLKIRQKCQKWYEQKGLGYLIKKLKKLDPLAYDKIDLKNPRRVLRALEVFLSTGKSIFVQRKKEAKYDYLMIGIKISREKLYQKINKRVEQMFKQGLEKEVIGLVKKYGVGCPSLSAIGYREFLPYFKSGHRTLPRMADKGISHFTQDDLKSIKEEIKKDTRNLARRQMTWWRKKPVKWVGSKTEAVQLVKKWLLK
jgi:tRNA dimethylallyltransferase